MPGRIEETGHRLYLGATGIVLLQPGFAYRESAPPARPDLVSCVWRSTVAGDAAHELRIIPDGCVEVAFTPGQGTLVFGPDTRTHRLRLRPGARYGLRLRPAAAATLLGDAAALAGDQVPLGQLGLGEIADDLPARVWVRELLGRLARQAARRPPDPVAGRATSMLEHRPQLRLAELVHHLGTTERQLRRRFAGAVGLSPVSYRRIARLHRAATAAARQPPASWARFAFEQGFADQAHFIRECRALTGSSPTALLRAPAAE